VTNQGVYTAKAGGRTNVVPLYCVFSPLHSCTFSHILYSDSSACCYPLLPDAFGSVLLFTNVVLSDSGATMTSPMAAASHAEDDEIAMEKNAGLIMGVSLI